MSSSTGPSSNDNIEIHDKLRRLPASASNDYRLFRSHGDEEALTRLIIAVLTDLSPEKANGVTQWSDATRLMEDLKFDSLSIAETIFFFEDLFEIRISNEEIMKVGTLGELKTFVKRKVSSVKS